MFCLCCFHFLYLPRIKTWMLKYNAVTKLSFFSLRRSMMPCFWSSPGREFRWWPLLCLQTASPLFSMTCCRSSWAKLWVLSAAVYLCRPISLLGARYWFCTSTTGPMWGRPDFDLILNCFNFLCLTMLWLETSFWCLRLKSNLISVSMTLST